MADAQDEKLLTLLASFIGTNKAVQAQLKTRAWAPLAQALKHDSLKEMIDEYTAKKE